MNPLLERMHNAKQTCDELKAFYNGMENLETKVDATLTHLNS